jgi:hypothetical protein
MQAIIKGINKEFLLCCSSLEAGKQRQIPSVVMCDLSVSFFFLNEQEGLAPLLRFIEKKQTRGTRGTAKN